MLVALCHFDRCSTSASASAGDKIFSAGWASVPAATVAAYANPRVPSARGLSFATGFSGVPADGDWTLEEKRNSAGSWFFSNDLVPIMLPLLVRITHALQTKEEIGRRDVSDSRQRYWYHRRSRSWLFRARTERTPSFRLLAMAVTAAWSAALRERAAHFLGDVCLYYVWLPTRPEVLFRCVNFWV